MKVLVIEDDKEIVRCNIAGFSDPLPEAK